MPFSKCYPINIGTIFVHTGQKIFLMKKYLIIVLALVTSVSFAQPNARAKGPRSVNFERVEDAQVPEAVKNSFSSAFANATAVRWEKHSAQGKRSFAKYVAIFSADETRSRARFKEDGTPLSSSKYFGPAKLPENIKSAAQAKAPGFIVMGGEEITTKNGKTFYRVRSRKGSSKLIQYFDSDGNELTKDKTPEEVVDGEEEDGN